MRREPAGSCFSGLITRFIVILVRVVASRYLMTPVYIEVASDGMIAMVGSSSVCCRSHYIQMTSASDVESSAVVCPRKLEPDKKLRLTKNRSRDALGTASIVKVSGVWSKTGDEPQTRQRGAALQGRAGAARPLPAAEIAGVVAQRYVYLLMCHRVHLLELHSDRRNTEG
jgi:hypothetical protein